jgi:iron complex outermembrane receptor protein
LEFALTRQLTFRSGLSLLHTRFTSFPDADITTPSPGGGTLYAVGSAAGKQMPFAPQWTFNTAVDYVIPTPVGNIAFNATYLHNSGWYAAPDNRLRQAAYNVVNGQAAWKSTDLLNEVRLWGKNIGNQDYAETIFSQARGDVIEYAPPRTYGVTYQRNF